MNPETVNDSPIEEMNAKDIELMTNSLARDLTTDLHDYALDVRHPLWQRMKDIQLWLAPSKTDDEITQIVRDNFKDDSTATSEDLQHVIMEGLGLHRSQMKEQVIFNGVPDTEMTEEQLNEVANSLARDITADFHQHNFDESHPVWTRLINLPHLLLSEKAKDDIRELVQESLKEEADSQGVATDQSSETLLAEILALEKSPQKTDDN